MKKISVFVNNKKIKSDGTMIVYLRIRDERNKEFLISTGLTTKVKFTGREFPRSETGHTAKTNRMNTIYAQVEDVVIRNPDMPMKDLKEELAILLGKKKRQQKTIADYINDYASMQKQSTARLYKLTADRVMEYDKSATCETIDKQWLVALEQFLSQKGLSVNGIAQKMRNIRAVMNWCIDDGITKNYPFRGRNGYKIKEQETAVNNLTAQEFADLRDYPCEPWQEVYRDMFVLSVYLAGINAGDLLLCERLQHGRLVFVRRKTEKKGSAKSTTISLPVFPEAEAIINKYKGKKYLLSIMDSMTDYHTFLQHWNKALKKIGTKKIVPDKAGKLRKIEYHPLFPNITTYTARYTFASVAANNLDVSERTIGKCLGHAWSKEVTARYIRNDQKKMDDAIRRVIDYLNSFEGRYKQGAKPK